MSKNRKKKTGLQIAIKVISIILIIMIVLVLAMFAGGWIYINSLIGKVQQEQIDINQIGIDEQSEKILKNYRNIALLGVDSREDTYETYNNRSDCIIIASINEETKDVKLFSVYRDTYLLLNENGVEKLDKVTHAYVFGGAQNTLYALNTNLDLNIKEYVTVNFEAVMDAVDAIGGVSINLTNEEVKLINTGANIHYKELNRTPRTITKSGMQTLDGPQVLTYSRIRSTDGGDLKRTERMRNVLEAMVNKAKTLDIGKLTNLVNLLLPKISTNLSTNDIISLVPTLLKINLTDNFGWPYKTEGITLDRWYGVPITLESNVIRLHQELFKDEDYELPEEIKKISDQIVAKTGYKE